MGLLRVLPYVLSTKCLILEGCLHGSWDGDAFLGSLSSMLHSVGPENPQESFLEDRYSPAHTFPPTWLLSWTECSWQLALSFPF